jgi:acyl CoA:acetate/3-ketoacid CoA transferase alpha subunit
MSEVVTIGGLYSATIYGTVAAATNRMQTQYGERYTAFLALAADDQKRALVAAAAYIDRQSWIAAYDTFAERDALAAFQAASYELAALIVEDESIVTVTDQGANVERVEASGAGVTFFNPTSPATGTATPLPPILMALIGAYLASSATTGPDGGSGQSGSCVNPFSSCSDYDRSDPY